MKFSIVQCTITFYQIFLNSYLANNRRFYFYPCIPVAWHIWWMVKETQ